MSLQKRRKTCYFWQFEPYNFGRSIAGKTYTVSAHVKTASLTGGVEMRIYWLDSSGNWIFSNIITPGATGVSPMIVAHAGSGLYWIDSLEVYEE